ncbi:pentatricopeptide repeat-containing protein At5g59600-like [Durio zibethinus]|uniref:Pentatricopeptide repeat-containing protein At5g59600-like n=1 Tax=Durio zibethinus TaxID=66656 RepID=A0A6P5ZNC3_DURZI|nr:pentatricopeptide repeat-containing protein At5g59600-like [Durio zibethinus]
MKTASFFGQTLSLSLDHIALFLQKCLKAKALKPGKQLHASLLVTGTDMEVLSLSSKLVGMYAGCGDLKSSGFMFEKIKTPNVFAVNWMVLAFAFNGYFKEAIGYFSLLSESINLCNKFTFSVVLKACVGLMDLHKGKEVHAVVSKLCLESDADVGNGLIDMYCKCGNVSYARRLFDRMTERDIPSWTSMICGYCNVGKNEEALGLFERMKLEGLQPNEFTWNAMIAGFARRGDITAALALFGRMNKEGLVPDLVTWNAIISGFAQSQCPFEALNLFGNMLVSGMRPNHVTVTGLLPACGLTGSIQKGREIHCLIYRLGLDVNVFIASALIDMYSKCGSVKDAKNVFDKIPSKNVASWNALIGCYGNHGMVESAIKMFERMQEEGVQADDATLTSVLSACSHSGYVEKGLKIFRSMKQSYGIEGAKEHYACVVDMLCRSGRIVEAYEFVKEMPFEVTDSILGAFFNGCKVHGRKDLAELMSKQTLKMELKRPGGFVTLSNIYAADGEWEEVENVRKLMKEKKIHKKPGFSRARRGGFVGE